MLGAVTESSKAGSLEAHHKLYLEPDHTTQRTQGTQHHCDVGDLPSPENKLL